MDEVATKYEIVQLRLDIIDDDLQPNGDLNMVSLQEDMGIVLTNILVQLSESIDELQVSKVEEHTMMDNNRKLLAQTTRALVDSLRIRRHYGHNNREQSAVTLYFDVYVEWDEGQQFGPIIMDEMRERYDEIVDQIR